MIRASALTGYIDLVNHLGGDADTLLARFDLDRAATGNPDAILPFAKVAGLLEEGCRQTGYEDFALRLAAQQDLMSLGQLAVVALNQFTVGEAIDKLLEYIRYYSSSVKIRLEREFEPGRARLEFALKKVFDNPRYSYEHALGIAHNCIRSLYGESFHPLEVQMQCASPLSRQRYWRFFQAPMRLEQEHNALILASSQLEKAVDRSNPNLRDQIAHRIIDVIGSPPQSHTYQIEQVIRRELTSQRCTPKFVARELGMSLPDFEARLAAEYVDFDLLLDKIRLQRADIYLESDDIPIREVALRLGFRNKDELAAACRHWFGVAPLQRRHQLRKGD